MKCKQCQKEVYGKQIAKGTGTCKVCYAKHDSKAESEKKKDSIVASGVCFSSPITPEGKEITRVLDSLKDELEALPMEEIIPVLEDSLKNDRVGDHSLVVKTKWYEFWKWFK